MLKRQGLNFLTFGLLRNGEGKNDSSIFASPAIIPFAWNFILNMLLVLLLANIEVRITSIIMTID